jgi:hypothetical protein
MNERPQSTDRSRPVSGHDGHDLVLIAAFAAGDVRSREGDEAERLAASCPECASLLADLRSIAQATRQLPDRSRPAGLDFRLTEDDARRLGATGWRRALQELASARFAFTRPLAVGLTTLGLVGVISASIPGGIGFGAASSQILSNVGAPVPAAGGAAAPAAGGAPSDRSTAGEVYAQGSPAASAGAGPAAPGAQSPVPSATSVGAVSPGQNPDGAATASPSTALGNLGGAGGPSATSKSGIGAVGQGTDQGGGSGRDLASEAGGSAPSPILILSILAIVTGVLLLVGQWLGDRLLVR